MPLNEKSIAILLGSYNGETFLQQQLNSYKDQLYKNWSLYVSDDGSSDRTPLLIHQFFEQNSIDGFYCHGPQKGFARNFISLTDNQNIQADYYAFSDQDDIWCNDKLERAEAWLSSVDESIPALYCSRTKLIDENNRFIGYSPNYKKSPSFANSLLQNIASGNTMVFNNKARRLLQKISCLPPVAHDWSLYQLVSGCGGTVYYDSKPTVLYRQHSRNAIGNGMNFLSRVKNFIAAHHGHNMTWYESNKRVLSAVNGDLTQESRHTLSAFSAIHDQRLFNRLRLFRQSGVYHQRWVGNLATLTYVLFNKL